MASIVPQSQLQTTIEALDTSLNQFLNLTNAEIITHNNFFYSLWGLTDSVLLSTLQFLYDNNRLYYLIDNSVNTATNLNSIAAMWEYTPSVSAINLSAGRSFYLSGGIVVLET
jgi:hypothetical protein